MIANYHTHNRWCRHAVGEIEDYIEVAVQENFIELGMTDHVPHSDNLDPRRIQWEEIDEYDSLLNAAIERYSDRIHVIKGFECEYYPECMDEYYMLRDKYGYELLILGQHRCGPNRVYDAFSRTKTAKEMHVYADAVCDGINTGLFQFLCHPDLALQGYRNGFDKEAESVMKQIFEECEKHDLPVEINGNGAYDKRDYPNKEAFLLSKDYDLRYLINMDAHDPRYLRKDVVVVAEQFAADLGIEVMPTFQLRK
ncbi:MAG: PHP domain-containing protein [Oscillospiraceae bacterium]|nr:PHP domain-containing protein [Oscillospiraceae bacterium]